MGERPAVKRGVAVMADLPPSRSTTQRARSCTAPSNSSAASIATSALSFRSVGRSCVLINPSLVMRWTSGVRCFDMSATTAAVRCFDVCAAAATATTAVRMLESLRLLCMLTLKRLHLLRVLTL